MNADRLLGHYEQIADAPDAVQRLRRFILDLAVRGKLVEQDPADEPASELLKRIAEEKARLVKAREIRKGKSLPVIGLDEFPFETPCSWEWVRIRNVMSDRGQTIPDRDFTYIDVTAINKEVGCIDNTKVISASKAPSRARKIVRMGDVLYSSVRPYLLNIAIVESEISPSPIASTAFAVLNGFGLVLPRYQWIVLRSPFMIAGVEDKMRGQAYPAINDSDFAILPFPLPPLAEQRRIVAKVDELMALCDRLEAARTEREATRDRMAAVSLIRLNDPDPDPVVFRNHAAFALENLAPLTTRTDQIKALRQTILNLAVRGKLVEQNPNDEPAAELLKRIAAERAVLVKQRQIRREKALNPIDPSAPPFEVPAQWVWSRLGGAVLFTQYGTSRKAHPGASGIPVLTMGNIQDGMVVWKNQKRIPESSNDLPALYLRKFDILYNRTNSAELVGKTGIYLGEDDCMTFASYLIRIRTSETVGCPQYLNLAMNTLVFRTTQIMPLIKKQTGQANVNGTALKNMMVPLPPLAEQQRIVTTVDELMALCDLMDKKLVAADDTRRRLLDALLYEALKETLEPFKEHQRCVV